MTNGDFRISLAYYRDLANEVKTKIPLSRPFSLSHMQFV